jgi:hypothetical protein
MTTATSNIFKSRWGYHSADYDTYRKLKALHKWYWMSLHMEANHERWYRKQPQNRILRRWIRDEDGRKVGFEIIGPRPEPPIPPFNSYLTGEYQNVRTPRATEKDVVPLRVSVDRINQTYFAVKAWFEANT